MITETSKEEMRDTGDFESKFSLSHHVGGRSFDLHIRPAIDCELDSKGMTAFFHGNGDPLDFVSECFKQRFTVTQEGLKITKYPNDIYPLEPHLNPRSVLAIENSSYRIPYYAKYKYELEVKVACADFQAEILQWLSYEADGDSYPLVQLGRFDQQFSLRVNHNGMMERTLLAPFPINQWLHITVEAVLGLNQKAMIHVSLNGKSLFKQRELDIGFVGTQFAWILVGIQTLEKLSHTEQVLYLRQFKYTRK